MYDIMGGLAIWRLSNGSYLRYGKEVIILFCKITVKTVLVAVLTCVMLVGATLSALAMVVPAEYREKLNEDTIKTMAVQKKAKTLYLLAKKKELAGASAEKVAEASKEVPVQEALVEPVQELESVQEPEVVVGPAQEPVEIAPVKDYEWFVCNPDDPEGLEWVKNNINWFYTNEEIRQTSLIVAAEDLMAYSDTIWSAHVWVILGRVGAKGFKQNGSIIGVLSAPGQFTTYTKKNLSKEVVPEIEWVVRDVFARKILEEWGASPETVGRTLPATHLFFKGSGGKYNYFYKTCWKGRYDPFGAPYNPYGN